MDIGLVGRGGSASYWGGPMGRAGSLSNPTGQMGRDSLGSDNSGQMGNSGLASDRGGRMGRGGPVSDRNGWKEVVRRMIGVDKREEVVRQSDCGGQMGRGLASVRVVLSSVKSVVRCVPRSAPFSKAGGEYSPMLQTIIQCFFFGAMVVEGGLVPKGLYLTGSELEKEGGPLTDDSIYHSISLGRGQVKLDNFNNLTGEGSGFESYLGYISPHS
uniref:Uncharacterized protein n=1 Tax=Timema poppense TaxID=170557 RepID=A0A7R9H2Y7_TIMPO|nr:unnamed protein product [Timema poppensis]